MFVATLEYAAETYSGSAVVYRWSIADQRWSAVDHIGPRVASNSPPLLQGFLHTMGLELLRDGEARLEPVLLSTVAMAK